jgi:SAM-dependent methyltransferase
MKWDEYYDTDITLPRMVSSVTGFLKPYIDVITSYSNGKKGLEAGCAEGLTSIYLSHLGYEITGLDNNIPLVEKAKKANEYFRGKAEFIEGDIFKIATTNKKFDFTFSQGVLEHFSKEQIQLILNEQLSIASRVIFSVPAKPYKTKDFGNENLWSYSEWVRMLMPFSIIYSFGFFSKMNKIQSILMFPLYVIAPKLRSYIRVRFFDTQIGFVIEKKKHA